MINRLTDWEWRKRVARFSGLERDSVERKQVMPVYEPPVELQSHERITEATYGDSA